MPPYPSPSGSASAASAPHSPTGPASTTPPAAATSTTVRAALADDLPAVASILEPYVTGTAVTFDEQAPDLAAWRQRLVDLDARGLPFLVAEVDGTVVGYAYAAPWRPKAAYRYTVEDTIYLAPTAQGRGIGSLLLAALLEACARAGVRQVVAVVADDPAAAGSLPLHRRFGFEVAGVLRDVGVKHGRSVSTTLLQRTLA